MSLSKSDGRKRAAMTADMKEDLEQQEVRMGNSTVIDKKTGERYTLCGGLPPNAGCFLCDATVEKKASGVGWAAIHPEGNERRIMYVCFECLSKGFTLEKRAEQ